MCASVTVCEARTQFVLVQHRLETHKNSNTGRLAVRALPTAVTLPFGDTSAPLDPEKLRKTGTWLLYPEGAPLPRCPVPPPRQIIVLDGTWSQARRMRRRIPALRGLPILALPPPVQVPQRLRRGQSPEQMSTIESIAAALEFVGEPQPAAHLRTLYAELVTRSRASGRS